MLTLIGCAIELAAGLNQPRCSGRPIGWRFLARNSDAFVAIRFALARIWGHSS